LKPSPTLGVSAKAKAMKAQGVDVISFAAGEPDFNTPEAICRAAIEAIEKGFTKYTPTSGIDELKKAVSEKLARDNRIEVSPQQVVVTVGAKHSVYNAMQVLLDPGDEVILIAPYWMTYAEQVRLAGGTPVVVRTEGSSGFVPTHEAIKEAITPRTKAIIINSPTNPTGAVWPRQTMKEVAALALRHRFWVVSDEIYENLIYGVEHYSIASLGKEIAEQTITVNGCSKSFAMTGWRIGYCAAPLPVAKAMSNLQDQVTSNPTSFAQKGAVVALNMAKDEVDAMCREFEGRRDLITKLMAEVPSVGVVAPKGAFYLFADFRQLLGGRLKDDLELADYLLDTAQVATIPGSVFEGPGYIRLSYAIGRADIERGVSRIAEALKRLA
jgi:aspartate aminotransferase